MKISLIVPVYNEEQSIEVFYHIVRSFAPLQSYEVEIIFINDGSSDKTEHIIEQLQLQDPRVLALSFTRNFGKEAALCAGLDYCTGDAVIPIDVDLQDPIEVIPQLLVKWEQGADVVLAKRIDRSQDNLFKRNTAKWFYKIHNKISTPPIEENVGDFRLLDRKVVNNILKLQEKNIFMKGLLSWVGGNCIEVVEYARQKRNVGTSRFNTWKLWNLAIEGITSFSTVPLRIWTYLGMLIAFCSSLYALKIILQKLIFGNDVPGYSSLIVCILFLGSIQLMGIGVLGEYIGRIYTETKQRPRYILKDHSKFK